MRRMVAFQQLDGGTVALDPEMVYLAEEYEDKDAGVCTRIWLKSEKASAFSFGFPVPDRCVRAVGAHAALFAIQEVLVPAKETAE